MSDLPESSQVILIRGKEYIRHEYDWYIDEALRLAPKQWTYEQIVCLRDAIREIAQHNLSIPVAFDQGNSRALENAIRQVILNDPVATIRYVKETLGAKYDR